MSVKQVDGLVSIVTPVYNAAAFLSETIKTVQSQTYENWEWILVDDVSTDDSAKIIQKAQLSDKRIKLIQLKDNVGAARARNAATMVAKGRYLSFLDADDLWLPRKLSVQLELLKKDSVSFVYSSYQFADQNGLPVSGPVAVPVHINYSQSLKNHIIWTSTVVIDLKKIDRELTMMPDVRRGQDAATWWQILRETHLFAIGIQEPLALYRRTASSLSANKFKAIRRTWYLYRNVEGLSLIKSGYSFIYYAYNAVRKRV